MTDCQACSPGMYCATDGLTAVTGPCYAGYYCSNSSYLPNPVDMSFGDFCPAGYVCPLGTASPQPCPAGTIQPNVAMSDPVLHCLACPGGSFCNSSAQVAAAGPCSAGFW